jgi:hypothetical protein
LEEQTCCQIPVVFWNSYKACEDSAFEQATVDLTESVCCGAHGRTVVLPQALEGSSWHEEAESTVTNMKVLEALFGFWLEF